MRMWRNGRRAGFRFQCWETCGFKSRHPHQIRTQNRIQEIVPNLRFLLLFRGIFALSSLNFILFDKKNLSFGVHIIPWTAFSYQLFEEYPLLWYEKNSPAWALFNFFMESWFWLFPCPSRWCQRQSSRLGGSSTRQTRSACVGLGKRWGKSRHALQRQARSCARFGSRLS